MTANNTPETEGFGGINRNHLTTGDLAVTLRAGLYMDAAISGSLVRMHELSSLARHWLRVMIMLITTIATPPVFASTTTSATFDGTQTHIKITWVNDGLDGGKPIEHPPGCSAQGSAIAYIVFYFNGVYLSAIPELALYPHIYLGCEGANVLYATTQLYGNPFTINIAGNVLGRTLCYGGVTYLTGKWGQFPGQRCTTVTAPLACSIASPSVDLAHGELALSAVGGNAATAVASLTCNAAATVKVRAIASAANPTATVPVRSDGSITSHLTVNGVDGAAGASVTVVADQPTAMTLGSTLASVAPTVGALQGSALLSVDTLVTKPIGITGNVVAPLAPKAVLKMVELTGNAQSNLGIRWSWSTTPADYGSTLVPANYSVGFFVRNAAGSKWSAFRVDTAASVAASWATRIQTFHDKNAQGGIDEPASRVFEAGTWCVTTGAASTPETGGTFIQAPGAAESCVTLQKKSGKSSLSP